MSDTESVTILLIEDSPTVCQMVELWLSKELEIPYSLEIRDTLASALEAISANSVSVAVLALNLPDSMGLDTFRAIHSAAPDIPVVIMSGNDDEEMAVAAVRQGAQDYIVKGSFKDNPLIRPIRFALERSGRQKAERELKISQEQIFLASAVQQELFPESGMTIPGFDIAGRCDPADSTGGDYYDFIKMIGGRWGIVIGDVSGHGLPAALFMIGARAVLRALVTSYGDVGFVLSRTNRILEHDFGSGRFVTMFFMSLNAETRTFRYAAAGHVGYLFDANGELMQTLEASGLPLGIECDTVYDPPPEIAMNPGDTLLLFTDGLDELMNPADEMFGTQRVFGLIKANHQKSAKEIIDVLFTESHQFGNGQPAFDDITAVVVKCLNEPG